MRPPRRLPLLGVIALVAIVTAACAGTRPAATPSPVPSAPMNEGEIRLFLGERLGPAWTCDVDSFPVGRDEQQAAIERFNEVVADAELYAAILDSLGLDPGVRPTDAQKLTVYRAWKAARAISVEAIGGDRYRFDYLVQPGPGQAQGRHVLGIVDGRGAFSEQREEPGDEPICPICLSKGTRIETPIGPVPVEQLRLGDPVWTLDGDGRRVVGAVIALGSTAAPANHQVVRLALADGRTVVASPGHPLSDGRSIGALRVGEVVDGSAVVRAELIQYQGASTFDLLVAGATGAYLAGGIPLGSTLRPR